MWKKINVGYKGGFEEEKGRGNDAIIKYLKEILIFSFSLSLNYCTDK